MSATTELLILQAAPAPIGASALGVPASEADYEAFSETLKAELNSGQAGAENGKSLPQGGENLPDESLSGNDAKAQQAGANPVSEQQNTSTASKAVKSLDSASSDTSTSEAVASETTAAAEMKSAGKSAAASDPINDAVAPAVEADAASKNALAEASHEQSALRELALQPMTEFAAERDIMPNEAVVASAINSASGQWTRAEIAERLDAIWHLLASSGEGALPGKLDTDLHQKLAHSQHPLAAIEQRLGQLAGAGVFEFTEAAYHDGTRATALTALATALTSDDTLASAMADSTKAAMNANSVLSNQNSGQNTAGGAVTPVQSQRLDAIWNMMASSGQGGIQGAIAAELHQALAYSDDSLDSIQLRLQALASEGASYFDKSNYFADRSLSERLITPQQVLDSGGAISRANPGRSGLLDGAPSANVEVDPGRAAITFVSAQKQPIVHKAGAMDRAVNQTTDDLQKAISAPLPSASQSVERADGIAALDRNTPVTPATAQVLGPRRAAPSVSPDTVPNIDMTASEWSTTDRTRTAMVSPESKQLITEVDGGPDFPQPGNVARSRVTTSLDARPTVGSNTGTLNSMTMVQGTMQDARLEGRLAQDLGGNRSVSFELSQATNTTASTTASTVTGAPAPSGLSASAPAASSAAMRTGGEHVMQNVPWAPQFSDEVGQQVRVFVNNGLQEARLQLTPADLGRVQITINTEGDNARVVFVAETAAARDLLDQSMPRLREMLQQSGIQLAQGDVSDQTESQRRGEGLGEDGQRLAQGDADAQAADAEQALRPQLGEIDGAESGAGRVDTYI